MSSVADVRSLSRLGLAALLVAAGSAHFASTDSFQAQVPAWMPWPTTVIYVSGVIEILLGLGLLLLRWQRERLGWITAAFFVAVFPGNISQWLTATDGFGLDSDRARFVRLLFQPLLVIWAIWCTREKKTAA